MNFDVREGTIDAHIFHQVFKHNEYELGSLNGYVVVDIGCHIGSFAAKAVERGAKKVVSFEPNKANFDLASSNLSGMSMCEVRNLAVGRSDIDMPMLLDMSDDPTNFGGSCTVTDHGLPVATISLDAVIEELSPKMIKIDAEGAEYPALYTCTKLDEVETIFGEFHNALGTHAMGIFSLDERTPEFLQDFKGRLNMRALAEFLKGKGFRVLVDDIDAQIGHFWASKTFQGLTVAPSPKEESALFPGKACSQVDLSSGSLPGDNRPMVFCISLLEQERLHAFDQWAGEQGQQYAVWAAVDARHMSREVVEQKAGRPVEWDMPNNPGALKRPAEVGLLLSSVRLWQHAFDIGLPYLAVLEDDAKFLGPLKFDVPIDADIVFFNDRSYRRGDGVVTGAICGTDGYLLTRCGIQKMLQIYERFWMPVDLQWQPQIEGLRDCNHVLSNYWDDSLPSLVAYAVPPLVAHSSFKSSIRS